MSLTRSRLIRRLSAVQHGSLSNIRCLHGEKADDIWNKKKVNAFVGHNFPDFIEGWNRDTFKRVGYGMAGFTGVLGVGVAMIDFAFVIPAAVLGCFTAGYWVVGLADIKQTNHAIRRNYPFLGNFRYVMETIRPELYQYIGKILVRIGLWPRRAVSHGDEPSSPRPWDLCS